MIDAHPSRADLSAAITSDLEALDKAESTPPPASPSETAGEKTSPPEPQQAITPAPVADTPPAPEAPLTLTDKSIVIDPADGQQKTWGEVKAERLRWKDYTQKTQAIAEAKRQYEAQEAQRMAAFEAFKAQQAAAALPQLPEDDPYAVRIKAIEAQAQYLAKVDEERQAAYERQMQEVQIRESQAALALEEKRLATEYGFAEREITKVEAEYLQRISTGEQVTLDMIAKEYQAYLSEVEERGARKFKERHLVSSPAAAASVPGAAPTEELPPMGTRAFREMAREKIMAAFGQ